MMPVTVLDRVRLSEAPNQRGWRSKVAQFTSMSTNSGMLQHPQRVLTYFMDASMNVMLHYWRQRPLCQA
jgi:hypothetical protein